MNKLPNKTVAAVGPCRGGGQQAAHPDDGEYLAQRIDFFDSAPVGYVSLSLAGTILQLNGAAAGFLGQVRPALLGKPFSAFVHGKSLPAFNALLAAAALSDKGKEISELRLLRLGPPSPALTVRIEASMDLSRQEYRLLILDITEHVRLEERLHEAEHFVHSLIDAFNVQICVLDGVGRIVAANQAWRQFHQVSASLSPLQQGDCIGAHYLSIRSLVCGAEEVAPIAEGIRSIYAGERDSFTLEYTRQASAKPRCFVARITPFPHDKRYLLVSHEDVSETKSMLQEMQLAALVYQAISEAIIVADADNRIVAVNPAFTRLTGYSEEEAIGKTTSLLKSGRQNAEFYRQMWHALDTTGHWQGEIWNRRKNGETYIEWLSISTIYDDQGQVRRRVAMFSDLTEQKRNEAAIWRQANYDTLTNLPNRSLFYDRLRQELKATRRDGHALALMLIDLDHFKEVNDTFGHAVGDQLLVETARRIGACIRETDTLARLGGDEFTVILPGLADTNRIERVAQDVIDVVVRPYYLGNEVAHVSASIGITLSPSDALDVEALMSNADQAMYAAKSQGRNRYSYFTAGLQRAALERQRLGNDLRSALTAGELVVYYQPIVHLATGRISKAEALLRWRHPKDGLVESVDFIHLAEEIGLINVIGDWVFREAARQAKQWQDASAEPIQVSINKSSRQFLDCVGKENWVAYLREIGLPSACVAIEITENLLLDDRTEVAETLAQFADAAVQIIIDDFGAYRTALTHFKKYRIDYLKVDQTFVRNMASDSSDLAIVEAIIAMAHRLGIQVIAENVETEAQRSLLAAAGCDYAQGYYFDRPMQAGELGKRILRNKSS
jgi:diguanylate cyclase (GGDEF)-like protein/PAS domain S-box-containing protein